MFYKSYPKCFYLIIIVFKTVSGLVHPGDIILQANGRDVKDPEKLQQAIEDSGEFIVFKIQPSSNLDFNGGNAAGPQALKSVNESKVICTICRV